MKEQLSEFKDEYQGGIKKKKAKSASRSTKLDVQSGAIDESGASIKKKRKKDKRTKQSSRDVQNHSSSLLADSDGRNFQNEWSESSASFRPTRMSPTNKNMQFDCDNQPNDNYQKKDFDADLFSSSLTPVSRKARRVSDPESILTSTIGRPRENKSSIFDDLASFAEASLGTTVDGVSDVISFAETMSTNRNMADNVSHELLVGYMISTGIPRQEAENLAFAFTSIHNVNSQRAKHRPISSSREFSVPLSPRSPHPNNPARSASTNKLDIIRGLDSSRNSSVRSVIRDDISVTSASSVRAPRNYVRAESPGAVEMEGRAFGAPYRHTSQRSVITDGAVVLGVDMGVDILVEAHPVEKDVESPIVYAESSPLPIQILCSKGPVRRTVSFAVLFISAVVGIMCYLLLRKESSTSILTESAAPSLAPTYIADAIYDLALEVSGKVALENVDSPQLRAVGWLSSRDSMSYQRYDKFIMQRYALVTFFFATNGNDWIDPENWLDPQSHECEWSRGIHCSLDESNQSIVDELDLSQNGLTGFLPLELGLLTDLTSLMLPKNYINGTIPQVILEIRKLSNIDLSSNLFFGKFPTSFGSLDSLDTLILSDNALTGELPSSLYGLPLLRILDLSANALNGEIESRIQEWVNLVTLDLSNNRFNGTLPGNVASFHKLDFLFLK
jgi:Leucine rich repeat